MIRVATAADIPRLIEMGTHFMAETSYGKRLGNNPDQMATIGAQLIENEQGVLFVAEQDGELVGMIGALCFAHHISGERVAAEVFWWVEPSFRGCGVRLMKRAEQWAKAAGAVRFQMVSPSPEVGALYERMGYEPIEVAYERAL